MCANPHVSVCVWQGRESRCSQCAVCDFMAQEALSCAPRTRRGCEWSGGSEPGIAHRRPLSRAPGSQSTPGWGGLAARPPLWGYVFRALGVAAGSGRPERASSPQLPATRLRRWAKAALTAAPSGAACKEGAHCLVRTLTRGFRTDTMLQ